MSTTHPQGKQGALDAHAKRSGHSTSLVEKINKIARVLATAGTSLVVGKNRTS